MIPGNYTLNVTHRAFSSRIEFLNEEGEQVFVVTVDNDKKDYMSFWYPTEMSATALKLERAFMDKAIGIVEDLRSSSVGTEHSEMVELKDV